MSDAHLRPHRVRGTIAPYFMDRHAIGPDDAIDFVPRNPAEAKALAALVADGVVRATPARKLWFDLDRHAAAETRRAQTRAMIGIAISVLIAAIAVLFYRG
ncbi:conserved hypothetical protein [Sphingomonas sp. EC-HK361]|uniref:hypothetical protein n=1 Tax=Sphingomonas sp. EC-HK361 TaxID=2038397 RepID=UPI001258735B|nr:hypothetical protein [Sphingomonas sp. EC-HK361]VVT23210.1 conserved hypothetical protein [Sphingomonas sp. EC-HK361]